MKISKAPLIALAFLGTCLSLLASDSVFYPAGNGDQRFNGVHELSDGTALLSGQADSMAWLPAGTNVSEIAATGIDSSAAGYFGFLLHLSADFSEVIRALHFPAGIVEDINHERATVAPGEPTGDLYI